MNTGQMQVFHDAFGDGQFRFDLRLLHFTDSCARYLAVRFDHDMPSPDQSQAAPTWFVDMCKAVTAGAEYLGSAQHILLRIGKFV